MTLSPRQREAVQLVREGRVQYGHEFQEMARRGRSTFPVFLIDGHAAYGQQGRTFASLEERGVIVVRYDLIPTHRVPEEVKTYRNVIGGEHTQTLPEREVPIDLGWRTPVELKET